MSVLFVCDHIFRIKEGNVYSNGFSYGFFKNYLDVYSTVTVVGRSREVENVSDLALASGEGVAFIFLENISTLGSFFGLRTQYRAFLGTLMDKHEGVIVRLPTELGLLAADEAHKRGKKCLAEVVGCAWDALWNYGGLKAKCYAPFLYMRMKMSVKHAQYVVYDTEKFLQERYPCSKSAKCLGISDVRLDVMDKQVLESRIDKITSQPEKIIFGTIGSLHTEYKGIDTAIKALAKLAKKDSIDFEYHIMGSGNPQKYKKLAYKYAVGDKVFFDGTMPEGDAVYRWLDHIDVYLQPSLAEALSRSLIEAMSRGCPAIGSDVGGIPELLDAKVIFPAKNIESLYTIILKLIFDKSWMKSQAERNFQRVMMYETSTLQQKRKAFWLMFKGH